jgi:hypothetical protein
MPRIVADNPGPADFSNRRRDNILEKDILIKTDGIRTSAIRNLLILDTEGAFRIMPSLFSTDPHKDPDPYSMFLGSRIRVRFC